MSRIAQHYLGDGYPNSAGYSEPTTSRSAAEAINATLTERQREVLDAMREAGDLGLTADETAAKIGRDVLAVRPRLTELGKHKGLIEKTGERRRNKSSLLAAVWRLRKEHECPGL
jgi:predicted transcriptional regulator